MNTAYSAANGRGRQRMGGDSAMAMTATESTTETRDRLVMEHVALVKTLAQRLAQRLPSQVEVSDLVGVGVLGLIDAFARRRVQGAMLDSLRDLDWAPRSLRRLRRDVDGAIGSLRRKLAREPEEA